MNSLKRKRANLLVQLLLQDLGASIWTAQDGIGPFDSIAIFRTKDKKLRLGAIVVKATEETPAQEFRFQEKLDSVCAMHHSNVPVFIFVVDVKASDIFYGLASDIRAGGSSGKTVRCALRVCPMKDGKRELLQTILSQPDFGDCPEKTGQNINVYNAAL